MRSYFSWLVVLAAVTIGAPVFAIAGPSSDGPQTYKVEGTVLNSLTGRPIPRALVQWNGQSGQTSLLTGSDGEFSFAGVPEGRAQFLVQKPGYFQGRGGSFNARPILFQVGKDSTPLVIKLTPEAVVSGRVLGKDGDPVEGAAIRIEKSAGPTLTRFRKVLRTDEDGNFRAAGLRPGQYLVAVQAGNVARGILGAQSTNRHEAYPPIVYYPSADEEANSEILSLAAGQHLEINFSIALRPAYKVAGVITRSEEFKQVAQPYFVDRHGQVLLVVDEFDSQTGTFVFRNVPAGTYTVRLSASEESGKAAIVHQRIRVQKDVVGLNLSVSNGITVPVHVRRELTGKTTYNGNCSYASSDGKVRTSDCSDYPALQLSLTPVDSANVPLQSNWAPPAGDTLPLTGLQPGRYKVHATAGMIAGGGYVAFLRCGGVDLLLDDLVVPDSGQIPTIEAVIRDDMATLHLLVNSDKNASGVIVVSPEESWHFDGEQVRRQTFTSNGMNTMQLAPGDYKIYAFADSADIDTNDPDEIALYAKNATAVTVLPGKITNLVLDLIRTGE